MSIVLNNRNEAIALAKDEINAGRFVKLFKVTLAGLVSYRVEIA